MIRFFKDSDRNFDTFVIYIDDNIYNLKAGIVIKYKPKTKLIKKVEFINTKTSYAAYKDEENIKKLLKIYGKEIDEFEVMFDNQYTILLKNALEFHKKRNGDSIFNKLIYKLNILNINDID